MSDDVELDASAARVVEATMRESHGRVVAILVGGLRDFDLAEEAAQDAWIDAVRTWERDGVPDNPVAWVVATARRRAIDRLRRRLRNDRLVAAIADSAPLAAELDWSDDDLPDDRLRLIFTCCHPAIAAEARVALTLRTVAGLTTREIARAFGVSEATMQQRIVRTKQRITAAAIPYRVPDRDELPERLHGVHSVIYTIFTEGYASTEHVDFVRVDLCDEAIRLGELVATLVPDEPESLGLLALMVLHDARRATRCDAAGDLVLLEDQDRTRWDVAAIDRGRHLLTAAAAHHTPGPFQLQAAIAALHAEAACYDATDWAQIALLYDRLLPIWPAPAARLARAVAIGLAQGTSAGEVALADLADDLGHDHRFHAARGHLAERAGRAGDATAAFDRAADLARHPREAARLRRRATDASASGR